MDQVLPQIAAKAEQIDRQRKNITYKAPQQKTASTLTVPPKLDHKQTFILLHGRGDQAVYFGGGLLAVSIPSYGELQTAFPHAKFIFPQAPKRNCARTPGWIMYQWFDNWGYDESAIGKENLKVEGLKETTSMVHDLIREEAEILGGTQNVVLGGLSQGCAASLVAFLTWSGEPLGGWFGMCGHLPFREQIEEAAMQSEREDEQNAALGAVSWLRKKIDVPESTSLPFLKTPAFSAHGDKDEVVPTRLGQEAAKCLKLLGAQSVYHEYEGLAHWYSLDMLHDFVKHLKSCAQWHKPEEINPTATIE